MECDKPLRGRLRQGNKEQTASRDGSVFEPDVERERARCIKLSGNICSYSPSESNWSPTTKHSTTGFQYRDLSLFYQEQAKQVLAAHCQNAINALVKIPIKLNEKLFCVLPFFPNFFALFHSLLPL